METKDLITIIGWPVSCLLSILAGGYIIPKLTRKNKILSWAPISESTLVAPDFADASAVPIKIEIGGVSPKSVTLVTVRIGNSGNEVIENISAAISANPGSTIHYIKPSTDLGEFQQHIQGSVDKARAAIRFAFVNPGFITDFEMLISDYDDGAIAVDCSSPGVQLRRLEVERWQVSATMIRNFGASLPGGASITALYDLIAALKSTEKPIRRSPNASPERTRES